MRTSLSRIGVSVVGLAAAVGLLTACDKPTPRVTVQSGGTSVQASASLYCFDAQHCRTANSVKVPTVRAARNAGIIVSVPRQVAEQHWVVSAFTVDTSGKATPVDGAGSTGLVGDTFTTRVFVPNASGSYFLRVTSVRGTSQSGTWTVRVAITS